MFRCKVGECEHGAGNLCCFSCSVRETCKDTCEEDVNSCTYSVNELSPVPFEAKQAAVIKNMVAVMNVKKQIEEQEKQLKESLCKAMEENGIKSFKNDVISITYVAETTTYSIDSKTLKAKYPDIAAECSKDVHKSAYVKITVK